MTFDVFGRRVRVERRDARWLAFFLGADGKRRPATDIVIPADLAAARMAQYLEDLLHEWASERHREVRRLD